MAGECVTASSICPLQLSSWPLQLSAAGVRAVHVPQPLCESHVSVPKHVPLAFATLQTSQAYRYLGENLVAPGDLDGDGFEDLVSSVQDANNSVYGFAVMRGGPAGVAAPVVTPGIDTLDPNLGVIGDTDGDGDDELLVGIPRYDSPAPGAVTDRGVVAVLKLGANNRFSLPAAGDYAMGNNASNQFGTAITSGDFDGTGLRDFVGTSPYPGGASSKIDAFYDVP